MTLQPVSIVIPNWNGRRLLERNLPSVLTAARSYDGGTEIIVVDDGGLDGTPAFLARMYPAIRVIRRRRRGGYSSAVNDGIAASSHGHVLLLNNDVEVDSGFLRPLMEPFTLNPNLFAASSHQTWINADGSVFPNGFIALRWEKGHLLCFHESADRFGKNNAKQHVANGGCSLFDREKLLSLGGFCPLFNPFYSEDVEVSVRALRRGWEILFVAGSRVVHRHGSSSRRRRLASWLVPARNHILLHVVVLDARPQWRAFAREAFVRACVWPFAGRFRYTAGLFCALLRLRSAVRWRRVRASGARLGLAEALTSNHGPPIPDPESLPPPGNSAPH